MIFSGFWNFPPFFPTCLARRKEREISKAGKIVVLKVVLIFFFPLGKKDFRDSVTFPDQVVVSLEGSFIWMRINQSKETHKNKNPPFSMRTVCNVFNIWRPAIHVKQNMSKREIDNFFCSFATFCVELVNCSRRDKSLKLRDLASILLQKGYNIVFKDLLRLE